jgi:hypothetical protein
MPERCDATRPNRSYGILLHKNLNHEIYIQYINAGDDAGIVCTGKNKISK